MKRRWIKNKLLVPIVLALGITIWLNLIFRPPLLASEVPSAGVINFLVDNTEDLSLQNTQQSGDVTKPNEQFLDLGDLGKVVISTNSRVRVPDKLSLSGNEASVNLGFGIQHQVEDVQIPPHIQVNFQADASDTGLLTPQGEVASILLSKTLTLQQLEVSKFEF